MENDFLAQQGSKKHIQQNSSEVFGKIAQAANIAASRSRFSDYQQRKSEQTLRRQRADLALFQEFLAYVGIVLEQSLYEIPDGWSNITWGLVEAFIRWQLQEGYAINSVNVRLSTVKTYTKLAMQCGVISPENYALIRSVTGYAHKEGIRVDQKRRQTRVGLKKTLPVNITPVQARLLKDQPDTPQGRRDALMMCLLLDHGLRVGELASLMASDINIEQNLLVFYRQKVSKTQKHRLTAGTRKALDRCLAFNDIAIRNTPLLHRSLKNKELSEHGMTERGITHRVKILGEQVGLIGLSAHDCRHYWATSAAKNGTDPFSLQEAGGWSSLAMPRRYIEDNEISNDGIQLG